MRFLLDTSVPRGLTAWIITRGFQAGHVLGLGLGQVLDPEIWKRATAEVSIIVSKDEDFADMVRRSLSGPAVVWLRTGNGTTSDLFAFLEPLWDAVIDRLDAGDRLVEIR